MLVLDFFFEVSKIWQKNYEGVLGDDWVELQQHFMDVLRLQFENKSKKFTNSPLEFTFLPEQSVPMRYRLDEFIRSVFILENSPSFFKSEITNNCLKVSIEKDKLTSLVASANAKSKDVKPKFHFTKEERSYTRNTSTVLESKTGKKRKREEEKEEVIRQFLLTKTWEKKKVSKSQFRCELNDFLSKGKAKIYFMEDSLDELLSRLYPGSYTPSSPDYLLQPILQTL